MLSHVLQLIGTTILIISAVIAILLDALGYAEAADKHLPWLGHIMKNRSVLFALLLFAVAFLMRDFHDAVALAPPPPANIVAPRPPEVTVIGKTTSTDPKDIAFIRASVRGCGAAFLINSDKADVTVASTLLGAGYKPDGDWGCVLLNSGEYGIYRYRILPKPNANGSQIEWSYSKSGVWGKH